MPKGAVKDESTFFLLLILLLAFIGAAIYLRLRRRREDANEYDSDATPHSDEEKGK